jgi:hypothetical protein
MPEESQNASSPKKTWLDELSEIRQEDKTKQEVETKHEDSDLDLSIIGRPDQAARLLGLCDAHKLLRRVQSLLLDGKGMIDVFDRTKEYERAIALVWQGPVSKARRPNPEDPEPYQYILVGATSRKVYVNKRELEFATPEALKEALVWAARNPMQWMRKSKTGSAKK